MIQIFFIKEHNGFIEYSYVDFTEKKPTKKIGIIKIK